MGAGSPAAHVTILFWNFTSNLEYVYNVRLGLLRPDSFAWHSSSIAVKRGLRFVLVFCTCWFGMFDYFGVSHFVFTFICLGSALVVCFPERLF